jgi:hypothetical protein
VTSSKDPAPEVVAADAHARRRLPAVYRLSHLARPVDPRYPTNRAILVLMGLALVLAGGHALWRGAAPAAALSAALSALGTVFFTWALGRELAPDDNAAAFVGVALASVAWVELGEPNLWLVAYAVALTRVVNRSTGLGAKLSDSTLLVAGALALGYHRHEIAIVGTTILALVLDARLEPRQPRQFAFAALAAAGLAFLLWRHDFETPPSTNVMPWWLLLMAVLACAACVARHPEPVSPCDVGVERVDKRRVQAGMLLALVLAVWATRTASSLAAPAAVWSAFAGVLAGRLLALRKR